jgi:hypothetical protein
LDVTTLLTVLALLGGTLGIMWLNSRVIPTYSAALVATSYLWWIFPLVALIVAAGAAGLLKGLAMLAISFGGAFLGAFLGSFVFRDQDPVTAGTLGFLFGLMAGGYTMQVILL